MKKLTVVIIGKKFSLFWQVESNMTVADVKPEEESYYIQFSGKHLLSPRASLSITESIVAITGGRFKSEYTDRCKTFEDGKGNVIKVTKKKK